MHELFIIGRTHGDYGMPPLYSCNCCSTNTDIRNLPLPPCPV